MKLYIGLFILAGVLALVVVGILAWYVITSGRVPEYRGAQDDAKTQRWLDALHVIDPERLPPAARTHMEFEDAWARVVIPAIDDWYRRALARLGTTPEAVLWQRTAETDTAEFEAVRV